MRREELTRRALVGGMGIAGAAMLTGRSVAARRLTPVVMSDDHAVVGMDGVDAANSAWSPGPLPDGMPAVGAQLLSGVSFTRSLVEEAGLLMQDGVLYAKGRPDTGDSALFALDGVTGKERWRRESIDALLALTPDAAICSRLGRGDGNDVVVAIALADPHDELWSFEARPQARTVVIDGRVLISTGGGLLMLDAESGEQVWGHRVEDLPGAFAVAVAGDVAVGTIPTESDRIHAWTLDTGEPLWELALDRPVQTAPVVDGDGLLVCDPLELIELELESGTERSRVEHGWAMPFRGRILLAEGVAIVWDIAGARAIDRASRELVWQYTPFYGMASEQLCVGTTLFVMAEEGAEFDDAQVIEAVDTTTGEALYELPARQDPVTSDDIRQFLVADGRVYLASTNGLRICEGTGEPYAGLHTPVQGNSVVSTEHGFSYSWSDDWEPGQTSWFLGEGGLQLSSQDDQALVTQYVQQDTGGLTPEEAAWAIAGVPAVGEAVSFDPAPLGSSFPRTFGPDTSRLIGLEGVAPPDLQTLVPAGAGVALVLATTRINPPFDRMACVIVAVPLFDPNTMLVFEFATAESEFDARLDSFLPFLEHLTIE